MVFRKVQDPKRGTFPRMEIVRGEACKNHEEQIMFTLGYVFVEMAKAATPLVLNQPGCSGENGRGGVLGSPWGSGSFFCRRIIIQTGIFVVETLFSCNMLIPLYKERI